MAVWVHNGQNWVQIASPHVQTSSAVRAGLRVYRRSAPTTHQLVWVRSGADYIAPVLRVSEVVATRNTFSVSVDLPPQAMQAPQRAIKRVVVKMRQGTPAGVPSDSLNYVVRNPKLTQAQVVAAGNRSTATDDVNNWSDFFQDTFYRENSGRDIKYGATMTKRTDSSPGVPASGVYGTIGLGVEVFFTAWILYEDGVWSDPVTVSKRTRAALEDPFGCQTFKTVVEPISEANYAIARTAAQLPNGTMSGDAWSTGVLFQGGTSGDFGMLYYGDRIRQVFREATKSGFTDFDRRVTLMTLRVVRHPENWRGARDSIISIGISRDGTLQESYNRNSWGAGYPSDVTLRPNNVGPEVFQFWSGHPYYETPAPDFGMGLDVPITADMRTHYFSDSGGMGRSIVFARDYWGRFTPGDQSELTLRNDRSYMRYSVPVKGDLSSTGYITITWKGYSNPWPRSTPGAANFKPMTGEESN